MRDRQITLVRHFERDEVAEVAALAILIKSRNDEAVSAPSKSEHSLDREETDLDKPARC